MPFDGISANVDLFIKRRESAADLFRSIDPRVFNLRFFSLTLQDQAMRWANGGWLRRAITPRPEACALGWLSHYEHDGWHWVSETPSSPTGIIAFTGASMYFGLHLNDAVAVFCSPRESRSSAYKTGQNVTPEVVADALLSRPFVSAGYQ